MSGSKRQPGQDLEHLDGSHAQRDAGHEADIVDQSSAQMAVSFVAHALPGALDVCPYCLDEAADIAAQQLLQPRQRAALYCGFGPATAEFFRSAEQFKRMVERVDEQV